MPHDIHLQTTNWRDELIPHQISSTVGMDAMRWLASIHGRMFDFWCLAFLSVWIFTAICIGCTIGMVRARPTLSISQSVCFQLCWSHDEYCVPSSPSLVVQCTLVVRPSTANIPVVAKWAVDTVEVILADVTWDEDETWSRFWGDFQLWFIFMDFVTGVTALEFDTVTSGTVYYFSSVLHGT